MGWELASNDKGEEDKLALRHLEELQELEYNLCDRNMDLEMEYILKEHKLQMDQLQEWEEGELKPIRQRHALEQPHLQQIADMGIKHLKLLQSKELELTHKQAATELKKKLRNFTTKMKKSQAEYKRNMRRQGSRRLRKTKELSEYKELQKAEYNNYVEQLKDKQAEQEKALWEMQTVQMEALQLHHQSQRQDLLEKQEKEKTETCWLPIRTIAAS